METQSWIRSSKNPETIPVRDEGVAAVPATDTTPEIPAREPWPEGHAVYIKDRVNAGDTAQARKLLASRAVHIGDDVSDGGPEVAWYLGSLTSCAVMIVRVEGEMFTDPDTGTVVDFSGGPYERLAAAQKLPNFVVEYVGGEIDSLSSLPFTTKKAEPDPETASGHGSIRRSPKASPKRGGKD